MLMENECSKKMNNISKCYLGEELYYGENWWWGLISDSEV
jgi:hypothetical protein